MKKISDKIEEKKFSTDVFHFQTLSPGRGGGCVSHVFVCACACMHVHMCARACGGQSSILMLILSSSMTSYSSSSSFFFFGDRISY